MMKNVLFSLLKCSHRVQGPQIDLQLRGFVLKGIQENIFENFWTPGCNLKRLPPGGGEDFAKIYTFST